MRIALILLVFLSLQAKHLHREAYYQHLFCKDMGGTLEARLTGHTRVDCLTYGYAIEVDFASKFYQAIGQSLHYSIMTSKKAGIYLIIENKSDMKYLDRLNRIADKYNIKVWKNEKDYN